MQEDPVLQNTKMAMKFAQKVFEGKTYDMSFATKDFVNLQYRSKVSYHPLARRDSHLERQDETRLSYVEMRLLSRESFKKLQVHVRLLELLARF